MSNDDDNNNNTIDIGGNHSYHWATEHTPRGDIDVGNIHDGLSDKHKEAPPKKEKKKSDNNFDTSDMDKPEEDESKEDNGKVVEADKNGKMVENPFDFDKHYENSNPATYMDNVYESLKRQHNESVKHPFRHLSNNTMQKQLYADTMFWGSGQPGEKLPLQGKISWGKKDTSEPPEAGKLGKFSLLAIAARRSYTPTEEAQITKDYEKALNKATLLNPKNAFDTIRDTPEADRYRKMKLSQWMMANPHQEFSALEGLPPEASARDAQKRLFEALDRQTASFDEIPGEVRDAFKEYLGAQLKATQEVPDVEKMTSEQKQGLTRNIMMASLLFKVAPSQDNMPGYDLQNLDFNQLNPKNYQSAFSLRRELLKLNDEKLRQRLGGALDGASLDDFRSSMLNAQSKDLQEHARDGELKEMNQIIQDGIQKGVGGIFETPAFILAGVSKLAATLYKDANTMEEFAANALASLPALPFEIAANLLERLAKALQAKTPNPLSRAVSDQALGRMAKMPISDKLANRCLNDFYGIKKENEGKDKGNKAEEQQALPPGQERLALPPGQERLALPPGESGGIVPSDGSSPQGPGGGYGGSDRIVRHKFKDGTDFAKVDGNKIFINGMFCKPLVGAPLNAEELTKIFQNAADDIPRVACFKTPNSGDDDYFFVVGDKDAKYEDVLTAVGTKLAGKDIDPFQVLQERDGEGKTVEQRHLDKVYPPDKIKQENLDDIRTFIAGIEQKHGRPASDQVIVQDKDKAITDGKTPSEKGDRDNDNVIEGVIIEDKGDKGTPDSQTGRYNEIDGRIRMVSAEAAQEASKSKPDDHITSSRQQQRQPQTPIQVGNSNGNERT